MTYGVHGNQLGNLHFYAHVLQSTPQNGPEINSMLASTIFNIDKFATSATKTAFDHSILLLRSSGATGKRFSDMLYSIATGDQSAASTTKVGRALWARLTTILLDIGENYKVAADLCSFNGGLQQSKYDSFWKFADLFVEDYKAAHD